MTNKKWIVSMLGAAAMAVSAGAFAQQADTGWYVGGSLGNAEVGSEDDTAWKIHGGYQVNRTFAAEFGYSNLGDFGGGDDVTVMELVGLGKFPIANQFSVYGMLGFANLEVGSEDETELTYGIGVQYDLSPKLGLRAQWQRYNTDEEVDVMSVGIVWKF